MEQNNSIRKEESRSAISLDKIYQNEFQKEGTLTAQIRQTVKTTSFYPSKKVDSNLSANIFDAKEFGFEDKSYVSTEERVAWLLVPLNTTPDTVKVKLAAAALNGARIYRVFSAAPILDDNQKYAVSQGMRTEADFANKQALRYPEGAKDAAGNDISGKLILDASRNVQYRRTFFSNTSQEDIDVRGTVAPYLTPELKAELEGAAAMAGQTL